jgi:formate/nitrite transporter
VNSPKEVAQNYIAIGAAKTKLSIGKMLWLGILAGMFIAFAGVASTVAPATVQSASLAKLLGAMVFPGGLAMVLIAGSELFTGNCLIIIPVLEKQATWGGMLKNWLFVYIGNLIGSLLVAWLVFGGHTLGLFGAAVAGKAIDTAAAKVALSFGDAFIRGILCNFLVCIAVWMAFAAKDVVGKIVGLFFPIMFFVLCGWEHSVANMYFIPAGLLASTNADYLVKATAKNIADLTWGAFFIKNLIPVTLGNIVGGSILVGLGYWFTYLRPDKKALAPAGKK